MRIVAGGLPQSRDSGTHQRSGGGAQRDPVRFVAIVVISLNQKAIARHHSQNASDRRHGRKVRIGRVPVEKADAGARAEERRRGERLHVTGRDVVTRVSWIKKADRVAKEPGRQHYRDFGAI